MDGNTLQMFHLYTDASWFVELCAHHCAKRIPIIMAILCTNVCHPINSLKASIDTDNNNKNSAYLLITEP